MSKPASSSSSQAKITQRLVARTAGFLLVLVALFYGYAYLKNQHGDFDNGAANSGGLLAAVQTKENGSEVVLIKPNGKIVGTKSWKDDTDDRELTWRPDGKFLFFTSNRLGDGFHVYRWNTDSDDASPRTADKESRSNPTFPADNPEEVNDSLLIVGGGVIQTLDAKKGTTPQLLPPQQSTITDSKDEEAGGSEGLFQALYGNLGTSFRYARWCKGNRYIAAIMLRDTGEVLVLQSMALKDGKLPRPIPVVAGDHIQFDINPKDGSVVYAVQGFKWVDPSQAPAQFRKGNTLVTPFHQLVSSIDPDSKSATAPIAANVKDDAAFASPAVSPDGSSLLVAVGPYDAATGQITSKEILTMPLKSAGIQSSSPLILGQATDPCWSPDGSTIAYALRANGKRDIYTCAKDGSAQTNRTNGAGSFGHPAFSPQLAK